MTFYISEMPGFTRRPCIDVSNINGNALNREIASFLEPNGLELTEHIRGEINSLDYTFDFKNYTIWDYHEIRNHPPDPPVAIFNTGGTEITVPVTDFLAILDEWRVFLESVPEPHWLDRRYFNSVSEFLL